MQKIIALFSNPTKEDFLKVIAFRQLFSEQRAYIEKKLGSVSIMPFTQQGRVLLAVVWEQSPYPGYTQELQDQEDNKSFCVEYMQRYLPNHVIRHDDNFLLDSESLAKIRTDIDPDPTENFKNEFPNALFPSDFYLDKEDTYERVQLYLAACEDFSGQRGLVDICVYEKLSFEPVSEENYQLLATIAMEDDKDEVYRLFTPSKKMIGKIFDNESYFQTIKYSRVLRKKDGVVTEVQLFYLSTCCNNQIPHPSLLVTDIGSFVFEGHDSGDSGKFSSGIEARRFVFTTHE